MQSVSNSDATQTSNDGEKPVEMRNSSVNDGNENQKKFFKLTERESIIYQAGLSFGASQMLEEAANQLEQTIKSYRTHAKNQRERGQGFLDRSASTDHPSNPLTILRTTVKRLLRSE